MSSKFYRVFSFFLLAHWGVLLCGSGAVLAEKTCLSPNTRPVWRVMLLAEHGNPEKKRG
jgi:hypothetical protein